ncbi:hypothetical protein [Paraburkholderia azotifigens]|uniref:Uncharacterized protein n=1 Tax=Paraburkholderia azotifigens TaxID=2057004 RepID=A0A5C6V3E9_9BURK|nr:hypothetical protein [Paraburkholderia azotifigens]TXC79086.1 hypothetical protein FRZ40_32175 [Paraburkholderia azotifigens]
MSNELQTQHFGITVMASTNNSADVKASDDEREVDALALFREEIITYGFQVFVFALTAVFICGFFQNNQALLAHMSDRINDLSMKELGFSLLAIIVAAGSIVLLWYLTGWEWLATIMGKIVGEVPRTLYFFGSSVGGLLIAASVGSISDGRIRFGSGGLLYASMFLGGFFVIGYLFRLSTIERTR